MADKVLNTRIRLRYDTYAEWNSKNPALLSGEIAICEVPVTQADVNGITSVRPQILMKVGPGNFNDLDWTNAKAADVFDWAKQAELFVQKSGEGNVVSSIAWDAALNNGKGGIKFTTASVATSEGLADLAGRVKAIEDGYATDGDLSAAVEAINGAIALKADKTYVDAELAKKQDVIPANTYDAYGSAAAVQGKLDEEVTRAKAAEEALGKRIDAIDFIDSKELATELAPYAKSADMETELGKKVDKSAYNTQMGVIDGQIALKADASALAQEVTDRENAVTGLQNQINLIMNNPETDKVVDSINEFTAWIEEHGELAEGMRESISANAKAIEDEAKRAGEAEVALGGRIEALEGIDHEAYIAADTALKNELNAAIDKKANTADLGELAGMDVADLVLDQYVLKSEAEGYGDILTKTSAATLYQPVGEYAAAVHKHEMADVNGLGDALAAKANAADLGDLAGKNLAELNLKGLAHMDESDLKLGSLAKKSSVEMGEVNGLGDALNLKASVEYVNGEINGVKSTYATKAEAQGYANAKDEAIAAAQKAGDDAQDAVDTLSEYVGEFTHATAKTVVEYINAKTDGIATSGNLEALAGRVTEAELEIDQISGAVSAISGDYLKAADKEALEGKIGEKVAQSAYDAKVKALEDEDARLAGLIDGIEVPEYTIVKAADSGSYAAVYNLQKDGVNVGASINIPKDIVVKSGSVVGDKIVLVLNDEAGSTIEIPVGSLIEYVTSGSATGDMVVVAVSDDHKVTASITDGTVTKAKLHADVQASLGKADTAVQPAALGGYYTKSEADGAFATAAQGAKADSALQAADLAPYETAAVAAGKYEPTGAEDRAKAYADGLAVNYATAAQGAKADTAMQPADHKVSTLIQDEVLVFYCGNASESF